MPTQAKAYVKSQCHTVSEQIVYTRHMHCTSCQAAAHGYCVNLVHLY